MQQRLCFYGAYHGKEDQTRLDFELLGGSTAREGKHRPNKNIAVSSRRNFGPKHRPLPTDICHVENQLFMIHLKNGNILQQLQLVRYQKGSGARQTTAQLISREGKGNSS